MAKTVNEDMLITEVLDVDMDLAYLLMRRGMHCIGCFASSGETLAEAMMVHGFSEADCRETVNELNMYLALKEEDEKERAGQAQADAAGTDAAQA